MNYVEKYYLINNEYCSVGGIKPVFIQEVLSFEFLEDTTIAIQSFS